MTFSWFQFNYYHLNL